MPARPPAHAFLRVPLPPPPLPLLPFGSYLDGVVKVGIREDQNAAVLLNGGGCRALEGRREGEDTN